MSQIRKWISANEVRYVTLQSYDQDSRSFSEKQKQEFDEEIMYTPNTTPTVLTLTIPLGSWSNVNYC